jgi:hypothetical protein
MAVEFASSYWQRSDELLCQLISMSKSFNAIEPASDHVRSIVFGVVDNNITSNGNVDATIVPYTPMPSLFTAATLITYVVDGCRSGIVNAVPELFPLYF